MRRVYELTINLAAIPFVALAIVLGITGKVPWWVIILIGLSHVNYPITREIIL